MRVSQEIRVIDLLARREAEFLRVNECEEQIRALLGGSDFPFPPPPVVLPSDGRTNAKKAWRPPGLVVPKTPAKKPGRRDAAATPPVQPDTSCLVPPLLAPNENAYLVHYQEKDKEGTSFLDTPTQVQALLELACESFRVTKVEAVQFHSLDEYQPTRTIWEPPAPQE